MTENVSQTAVEQALSLVGMTMADVRPSYTGRGMGGIPGWGVVVESVGKLAELLVMFTAASTSVGAWAQVSELRRMVANTRLDNMGKDFIAYWPGYRLQDQLV